MDKNCVDCGENIIGEKIRCRPCFNKKKKKKNGERKHRKALLEGAEDFMGYGGRGLSGQAFLKNLGAR